MKKSFSLFNFTDTKYKYLKRRITFLSNLSTNKKQKLKVSEKKIIEYVYGSWSLESEKVQGREVFPIKISSLESWHSVL